jgi:Methylase of chemotaxis methyl-accepting proteins
LNDFERQRTVKSDFPEISAELFAQVGKMITERFGIKMPADKKTMFQARLQRRLRELHITSFDQYVSTLFAGDETTDEFELLADFISTNKTEFFREEDHFKQLSELVIPGYLKNIRFSARENFKVWSAGCSSGQEAYSIGIQIEEFIRLSGIRFNYSIVATDISQRMLKQAKEAIYPMAQVEDVLLEIKKRYLLKSKNPEEKKIRIVKELREKVVVSYMNLMDAKYPFTGEFDVIFLRNTLIYFEPAVQLEVLTKTLDCLKPGGYLFIGHSESIINLSLPIKAVAPSIYFKLKNQDDEQ